MRTKPKSAALLRLAVICWAFLLLGCLSCEARSREVVNVLSGRDIVPPRLLRMEAVAPDRIEMAFDEPVLLAWSDFDFPFSTDRNIVAARLPSPLAPGEELALGGVVIDLSGNRMGFRGVVYGFNPRVPRVLITELTTSGTEKSPDRTELAVLSGGNMAGLCLCDGIRADFISRFVFPDCPVEEGDYVVVCWDGVPQSDPLVFHAGAGSGLSRYNGIQTLYRTPAAGATCLDCLLYANHGGTASGKFGSAEVLARAAKAVEEGWWRLAPGETETTGLSAVDSSKATATRSMARRFPYIDTDSASDWYTTENRGSTFGGDNTSAPYGKGGI